MDRNHEVLLEASVSLSHRVLVFGSYSTASRRRMGGTAEAGTLPWIIWRTCGHRTVIFPVVQDGDFVTVSVQRDPRLSALLGCFSLITSPSGPMGLPFNFRGFQNAHPRLSGRRSRAWSDCLDHELTASPQCSHSARTSRIETLRPAWSLAVAIKRAATPGQTPP